jgi:hypothetical protein
MKYLLYIIIGLAVVAIIYFGIFNREQNSQRTEQPLNTTQGSLETKTDNQLLVTIKVTPVEFGKEAKIWKFHVVFDTHSGSLDDDPLQVAVLVDDKGNTYQPTAWEGPGPGGHHREGILIFNALIPIPSSVELKVKNVGGVPERSSRWDLQ